jgi:tyrosyl-tRNA synthetase
LKGAEIREAKEILALEATKIVHGEEEAEKARNASRRLFVSVSGGISTQGDAAATMNVEDSIPTTFMDREKFSKGTPIFKLFETTMLSASGSEARRLIEQGGAYLNKKRVDQFDRLVKLEDFDKKCEILLRAGKKKYHRIRLRDIDNQSQ